jgi:hypothetical protein
VEMVVHLPGVKNLNKPSVLAFPHLRICMDCGSKESIIPESVLRQLGKEAATHRLHTEARARIASSAAFIDEFNKPWVILFRLDTCSRKCAIWNR